MNDSKPCPHCGNKKMIVTQTSGGLFRATCVNICCYAKGPLATSRIEAIEKWNDRK